MVLLSDVQPRISKETATDTYGKFVVEPLERGYGVTLGNAMRRALLSSLPGAAVTWVKIEGILHEFSTLPGVMEDVADIILNLKKLRFRMHTEEPVVLTLQAQGEKEVTGSDFKPLPEVEVVNSESLIATLTDRKAKLYMEVGVQRGKGYVPAEKHTIEPELGVVPVDAMFSPVLKVNYTVEDTRVGQVTDYNKLTLEVWTDKTVKPDEALSHSAKILSSYLGMFYELSPTGEPMMGFGGFSEDRPLPPSTPLDELGFSVRTTKCFKKSKMETLGELMKMSEQELMSIRNFGRTSLEEVKEKLQSHKLSLREEEEAEE